MKLEKMEIGYGDIRYYKEIDPVPASSSTSGNVTINNPAQPGRAAYFSASFMISADFEEGDQSLRNIFHWNCMVPNADLNSPYGEVELKAAKQIAPMLRAVADKVDAELNKPKAADKSDEKARTNPS